MIRHCFSLFEGIGPRRDKIIRIAGISDWQDFLGANQVPGLTETLYVSVAKQIREWSSALERKDADFFANTVPQIEHWALFEEFGDSVRYLDIETTGLSPAYHEVTVVGVCDGRQYQPLIKGRNLTPKDIHGVLEGCRLLVSYYGRAFDVPFLRSTFPELRWDFPHFDLCFAGRKFRPPDIPLIVGLKCSR